MLALPTVVWAGVLFAIVVYLGTMLLGRRINARQHSFEFQARVPVCDRSYAMSEHSSTSFVQGGHSRTKSLARGMLACVFINTCFLLQRFASGPPRFTVILLGNIPELEGYFGTIGLALWTHFVIVTMETWPDIADTVLAVASPLWGVYFVVSLLQLVWSSMYFLCCHYLYICDSLGFMISCFC